MRLKAVLTAILAVLGVLVLAAVGSLVLLTSYLHRVTSHLGTSIDEVRLAEELEVELLTHYRQADAQLQLLPDSQLVPLTIIEARLYALIDELEQPLAGTPAGRALIQDIRGKVDAYLVAHRSVTEGPPARVAPLVGPLLDEALAALEHLVEVNVQEAREAQTQANRWDRLASLGGMSLAGLLLVALALLLFWVRRAVLLPVMQVSQAMRRFGSGHKRTRAPETGPAELHDMARTFNEMAASLARQQEDQLTFLAGVAHDLRNPLSALKMSTALADPGRGDASPERIQKMLALVRRQVARLDRMVGDLLDATRIEAGKLELQFEDRDAGELARAVVELYQATGSSHELSLCLPETSVRLRCDGIRIEQVLNNLVSNALKYSPTGTRVEVTVLREGDEAFFSVSDQGIGISTEERRHLFTPFNRTHGARERAQGAGLGLSVARRIVEAHGGRIEVDSQPGQGSVFRVRLPLVPAAHPMAPVPKSSPAWTPGDAMH
ncbi:HAMP domain-containing sensor histidine kinase [Hyalangium sp.]|uniref:HAMP domain-containing sensor histidine kinase n=1 Tax=Hyalangium sp. TaxID=2028555 RepID=UPI002D2E4E81|nr:HAMP domain-containing sensor histidine kinase [Hyalangium sp.]HYI00616.1 HAMP domain-containing sensor histidine kinase [Hyalangium sp.]